MDKHTVRDLIEKSLISVDGKNFQKLVGKILTAVYGDFHMPKMNNDLWNDGYSLSEKMFCACYWGEWKEYNKDDAIKKINGDYSWFTANWLTSGNFSKWIFITKHPLTWEPNQLIVDMNNNGDGIIKEIRSQPRLIELCMSKIAPLRIMEIFDFPDTFAINDWFSIFKEIISYVQTTTPEGEVIDDGKGMLLDLKIECNFEEKEGRESMVRFFEDHRKTLNMIQKFITLIADSRGLEIDTLILATQSSYRRMKSADQQAKIENVSIIDFLAVDLLPLQHKSDWNYIIVATAIVLRIFEYCFFGKRRDGEEQPSLFGK